MPQHAPMVAGEALLSNTCTRGLQASQTGLTSSGMQLVTLPVISSLPALQCALNDAAICAPPSPRIRPQECELTHQRVGCIGTHTCHLTSGRRQVAATRCNTPLNHATL